MELTKEQIKITKGVAILFMLFLHLFCTKEYDGLYTPLLFIGDTPLIYYLALFSDCCVAIYCFCSGYGLFISYSDNEESFIKKNLVRILKLYINFWIILIVFVVILGPIFGRGNEYPGDIISFILTLTAISPKYNGAWWFITTYIILVIISPIINKIVKRYNSNIILFISFIYYLIGYIQRIKLVINFDNIIIDTIIMQLALLGTSQLPFIIGIIFAYKKIYSKLYLKFNNIKYKNILGVSLIVVMIIVHGFIETLFIAVFTGVIFICIFNLMDKSKWINKSLNWLSTHSTNMWLTHMFFYMIYFKKLVYLPKISLIIFVWLIMLCIVSSYVIKYIENIILKSFYKVNYKLKKGTSLDSLN